MSTVYVSNIRTEEHLCDIHHDCGYTASDVNVNTEFSYALDAEGNPDMTRINVPCPSCNAVSTYPTDAPGNVSGYALGQAKTA